MSISTPSLDVISSTCLSRAATVLKSPSFDPTAVMAPRRSVESLEGKMIVRGTVSFTTKSETFSVSLRFTSDEATAFAGATINSLTVSAA
ncbi:hypothetical protein BASA60_009897 [Batrachochytrium salamandrivorans]|nr:hypothetical protein BASA60_009897 [Batrachochytrium salamandrivorans]